MIANRQEWCRISGWTVRQFDSSVAEGFPVKKRPSSRGDDWQIDTVAGIEGIVARRQPAEAGDRPVYDERRDRARIAWETAEKLVRERKKDEREWLPADEVGRWVTSSYGRARAKFLALPTRAATALAKMRTPAEAQAHLTGLVREALVELADTPAVAEPAGVLEPEPGEA